VKVLGLASPLSPLPPDFHGSIEIGHDPLPGSPYIRYTEVIELLQLIQYWQIR
jgi:hypothetical protein